MRVTGDLLTDEAYLIAVAQLIAPLAPMKFRGAIVLEFHWSDDGLAEVKVEVRKTHRPGIKVKPTGGGER